LPQFADALPGPVNNPSILARRITRRLRRCTCGLRSSSQGRRSSTAASRS